VTAIGPNDGVEALDGIAGEVDLTVDNPSATLFTSGTLPVDVIAILGFLDTDGNADPDNPDPDAGDPVTRVGENKFEVFAGEPTPVTVYLGLLRP
jgi:hypothetical protein